jgi:hypothetical protein
LRGSLKRFSRAARVLVRESVYPTSFSDSNTNCGRKEQFGDAEQLRAIGWCGGRLCSVIFEIRHDGEGEYYHLITAWAATIEEQQSYAENV